MSEEERNIITGHKADPHVYAAAQIMQKGSPQGEIYLTLTQNKDGSWWCGGQCHNNIAAANDELRNSISYNHDVIKTLIIRVDLSMQQGAMQPVAKCPCGHNWHLGKPCEATAAYKEVTTEEGKKKQEPIQCECLGEATVQ